MLYENNTPRITPNKVPAIPIEDPVTKNILFIEKLEKPIVFKIAISLVLFLTRIVSPEIILKAATIIIKVKIINITFRSTRRAS